MSEAILLSTCPCGSQKNYAECCEPLITGEKLSASPEALMRSRYTAFTQSNVDYLFSSMTPELQQHTDREDLQNFAEEVSSWVRLEIIHATSIASDDIHGNVEFAAYFMYDGEQQRIHENSKFIKQDGQWFYAGHQHQCSSHSHDHDHDHGHHHQAPHEAHDKIGRNDLCPCGSGKKYKKCCIE
ncbi:MAG: SEC-C domain-containing protein [Gammaproteobacteria bacterium]|nr:SEC-C domain-containing protein [Gammaproteobacteria bacterium]